MVPEIVALGSRNGAGAPGLVGLESSRVVASSGSPSGGNWLPSTDCPLAPEVRALRGLKQRGCLFPSTSLLLLLLPTPGDAPPRGTKRVCLLCSQAVTTAFTLRPRIPTHLPLPGGGGWGEEAELRQEAESGLGMTHPVLVLSLGPSPSLTTETKHVRVV